MSRSAIRTKWLAGMMAAAIAVTLPVPVSKAAAASPAPIADKVPHYTDVPDKAWYAEAVNDWIAKGILSPKQGDKFGPEVVMTRGNFAFLFAYSLGLSPSENPSTFKDVKDDKLAGYYAALQEAGLAHGFPDGTFRSSLPVTRAEAASWIAAAKHLTAQTSSSFRDVPAKSWYAGAVNALTSTGIIAGKAKDRFAPGDVITRSETVTLLYRSFYKSYRIEDIHDDGTIIIDGHSYRADNSLKGLFQPSNKSILHDAAIQFTRRENKIVSVETLIIGYKDALDGQHANLVLNAQGSTINGTVIVDADQVTLANVIIKGDLYLAPSIQSNFSASNVQVNGETVYVEDANRPHTQVANLSLQNSDLGQLVLENSANLKQIDPANPVPGTRSLALSSPPIPSGAGTSPGLYVQVIDGLIQLTNSGGTTNFSAGQFGYVPSFQQPPIVIPSNPGLQFTPPPIFTPTPTVPTTPITPPSPDTSNTGGKKVVCENMKCDLVAFVPTEVSTGSTGSIGAITVQSGTSLNYTGNPQIDTLIIGDPSATSGNGATFTGKANINHVTVNGSGGTNTISLVGTIGTLEIQGTSLLSLPGNTQINNLILPAGVKPQALFANPNDLSKVAAINGQLIAPSAPSTSTPQPDLTPPNGLSSKAEVTQKLGSTTHAVLSIADADAAEQGVDYYKVFVAEDGEATTSDPYWRVEAAGEVDIKLDALEGGIVTPSDSQTVHFTIVAYDQAGNPSVPTINDKASVKWDKAGPTNEGLTVTLEDTDVRPNYIAGNIHAASEQSDVSSILVTIVDLTNDVSTELNRFTQDKDETTAMESTYVADSSILQIKAAPVDIYGNVGPSVTCEVTDWADPVANPEPNGVTSLSITRSSATAATLTITDTDAEEQGISYYRVYIAVNDDASEEHHADHVNIDRGITITREIDLSSLLANDILHAGDTVYFTVEAVTQTEISSVPTETDKARLEWGTFEL
ncbi:S-layer homology domain-containing protein [Paenibacillus glycanilyticus]|uniref:SLH domain-containing protein n=1 Tax=Paenibacillus glycanilyticus TaxID=126569 RepID=A0ABQ6GH41_9BACL|nr:S-layer homology domain-containing protein [Paenibacillus glycanilyticus]GLX69415.1 hypothetical protein MU1_37600 [Paenibacillus glycanilyticus]